MKDHQQAQLPFPNTWGGARPGAGRKKSPDSGIPHLPRERFHARFPCHVTLKVRDDVPSLRHVKFVREFERSLEEASERGDFRVCQYSLQGNHAHLIVEANGREALGRGMKSIAARLARAVNRVFQRSGAVLTDRYHLRVLRSPRQVRSALRYVLLNARKHARRSGGSARAAIDPASSAPWFRGWRRHVRVPEPDREPPVAFPHTWLLQLGWRGHGLLDPAEVPG